MTSLGETLRSARLKRNLELNRIADELKISTGMLRAIEEGRFDKLPGGVFARSFVRQYARFLEIDESEIEGELTRVLEPPPELPQVPHQAQPLESGIPLPRMSGWQAVGDQGARWSSSAWALVLMVLVMLACAGAYAWWQRRPVVAHQRPQVAAQASAPSAPAPVPAEPAPAPVSAPSAPVEAQTQPAPPPVAVEPPSPAPAAAAEPNSDAAVRVEVLAQEPTWISVRTDGQSTFSGVLDANQTRTLAANRNVLLKIGNAAGVEVRFNGKTVGPFGGQGAVRTIQFTSGGFQIVPPDLPKPALPTESPNPAPSPESPL